MRRLFLLLPLCLLGGCYYGAYDYYGYWRPYPPTYRPAYAPNYQSYGQPGYADPDQNQTGYQGYGQPSYLSPSPGQQQYQSYGQPSYAPPSQYYSGAQPGYGGSSVPSSQNCGTPDEPRPCY